jgi:ribosomal-protein-alanine N-acetyltransferase
MNCDAWPYLIEPMRLGDVPTVGVIERMVFARPWPVDAYNYELLENPKSHYMVARLRQAPQKPQKGLRAALRRAMIGSDLDRSLLGYGGLWMIIDEAHICTLAVHPEWRRKYIGELLLASLIEKATELADCCVTLEVRVSNLAAQHLYEKYGFNRAGLRKGYYSDNNEDAFIMTTDPVRSPQYRARFQELVDKLERMLNREASSISSPLIPEIAPPTWAP